MCAIWNGGVASELGLLPAAQHEFPSLRRLVLTPALRQITQLYRDSYCNRLAMLLSGLLAIVLMYHVTQLRNNLVHHFSSYGDVIVRIVRDLYH